MDPARPCRRKRETGPEWRDFPPCRKCRRLTSFSSRIALLPAGIERTDRAGLAPTARSAPYSIACRLLVTRNQNSPNATRPARIA